MRVCNERMVVKCRNFTYSLFLQTHVCYKKPRTYYLTPKRKRIGQAVARRCNKAIAGECLKEPLIRKYIIEKVGKILRMELCKLCSNKTPSTLRMYNQESFKNFTWDHLISEFSCIAPTLLSLFEFLTETKSVRHNRKGVIAVSISLLLKNRFGKACFLQKLVSLMLYSGHANKQVIYGYYHDIYLCVYI